MLEDVAAEEHVEGGIRIHPHVRDIDPIVDVFSFHVCRSVGKTTTSARDQIQEEPAQRLGGCDVEDPRPLAARPRETIAQVEGTEPVPVARSAERTGIGVDAERLRVVIGPSVSLVVGLVVRGERLEGADPSTTHRTVGPAGQVSDAGLEFCGVVSKAPERQGSLRRQDVAALSVPHVNRYPPRACPHAPGEPGSGRHGSSPRYGSGAGSGKTVDRQSLPLSNHC